MKMRYLYTAIFALILSLYVEYVNSQRNNRRRKLKTVFDPITDVNYIQPDLEVYHERFGVLPDGKDHPCYRNGNCDGKPMICEYHFHVEWYHAMSKACFDCPFNATDCERSDCVMADGNRRSITVVNRKLPGPSIEVCQGDKIRVNVTNDLMGSGTAIHWHGMHQLDTPFMDGVPFVTQCPIQPESHFTYEFYAKQHGTYFWHSHIGLQRGDGVSGALIIRREKHNDRHYNHIIDRSEHVIQIFDWTKEMSVGIYTGHYHADIEMVPSALLINGRGRFSLTSSDGDRTTITQAPIFYVTKNHKYRFRFISAQFYYCPLEVSVDDHDITITASDGYDLEPVVAKSLVVYAGERFDFIIEANQPIDNYWIRVRGIMNCENDTKVRQVGILRYNGAEDAEPGELKWEERSFTDMSINIENRGEEQSVTKTISTLRSHASYDDDEDDDTLKPDADIQFFVAYDLYRKNNTLFNKPPYYGHSQVKKDYSAPTPQLNHISMKLPESPLLVSRPSSKEFCNNDTVPRECEHKFCRCPHVLSVNLSSVVEVIIIDEGKNFNANHPFHLHGHSFRVLGIERLNISTTAKEVQRLNAEGKLKRNFINPPIKDTVTIPDGGYTIIRFKANNPGYWIFHCHIEFHAEVGMALVFKVGEHDEMKPVPNQFPICGHFTNSGEIPNLESTITNHMRNVNRNKQLKPSRSVMDLPDGGKLEFLYKPPRK